MQKTNIYKVLIFVFISFTTAQNTIHKEFCMSTVGYKGTIDELREELLIQAKRQAVSEFFGEYIASFSEVNMYHLTADKIVASSAGYIRIKGNPVYKSGQSFGDACVEIEAYVTQEDLEKFKPVKVSKRHCVSNNNMTTAELIESAKEGAIYNALIDYDRDLAKVNREILLPAVHNIKYIESDFITGTASYCVSVEGIIYPVEIHSLSISESFQTADGSAKLITNASRKGSYFYAQDFSNIRPGEIPDGWLAYNSLVTKTGDKISLTNFKEVNQVIVTDDIKFPQNWELEFELDLNDPRKGQSVFIEIANLKIEAKLSRGDKTFEYVKLDGTMCSDDFPFKETFLLTLKKKNAVFTLSINRTQIGLIRKPNFTDPSNIKISFERLSRTTNSYNIYKINGITL